jgi:hypothetical protein
MKSASVLVFAVAIGGVAFSATREAHALGPVDVEVGAKVGVATNPLSDSRLPNPLGFGLGGRAGVDFLGVYVGGQFMYYFGSSEGGEILGQSGSVSQHAVMYGLEAGYGFSALGFLTIRPQLGIGNSTFTTSGLLQAVGLNGDASTSNSNLYLEPGVVGLISVAGWFAGADANVLFFPGLDNSKASFSLHGQVGMKF